MEYKMVDELAVKMAVEMDFLVVEMTEQMMVTRLVNTKAGGKVDKMENWTENLMVVSLVDWLVDVMVNMLVECLVIWLDWKKVESSVLVKDV